LRTEISGGNTPLRTQEMSFPGFKFQKVRTLTISQPNERVLLLLLTAKKSCPLNNYALIVQEEVIKHLNVEVNWDVAIASEDITPRFVPV
jgi:hypothetical protein